MSVATLLSSAGRRVRCKACGTEYGENAHVCHATGCNVAVPPKMLMCRKHWYMVPRPLRDAIARMYVPGQEITKDPTDEYMVAQRAAVQAVELREGEAMTGHQKMRDAPHTIWRRPLALFRWWYTYGPLRLKSAQMRRAGDVSGAFVLLASPVALILLIRRVPDINERYRALLSISRKVCASGVQRRW